MTLHAKAGFMKAHFVLSLNSGAELNLGLTNGLHISCSYHVHPLPLFLSPYHYQVLTYFFKKDIALLLSSYHKVAIWSHSVLLSEFIFFLPLVQSILITLAYLLSFGIAKLILNSRALWSFPGFHILLLHLTQCYCIKFIISQKHFLNSLYKTPPIIFSACPVFIFVL